MSSVMEPLHEEHQELLPHIHALRTVADSAGDVSAESLRQEVDRAYAFLVHQLIPHATAEDKALYPEIGRLMGAARATATMQRDHVAIHELTKELGELRHSLTGEPGDADLKAIRRVLYGLYAVVGTHFAKEEEIYLPVLEAGLTAQEASGLFERLEAAAGEAKAAARG